MPVGPLDDTNSHLSLHLEFKIYRAHIIFFFVLLYSLLSVFKKKRDNQVAELSKLKKIYFYFFLLSFHELYTQGVIVSAV